MSQLNDEYVLELFVTGHSKHLKGFGFGDNTTSAWLLINIKYLLYSNLDTMVYC